MIESTLFRVESSSPASFSLAGAYTQIHAVTPAPTVKGCPPAALNFGDPVAEPSDIAGVAGQSRRQTAVTADYRLTRELFTSDDGTMAAVRLHIENTSGRVLHLQNINLLEVANDEHFQVNGARYADWHVFRLGRQKNDISGCYKPGVKDADFADAALQSDNMEAGMGVSAEARSQFTKSAAPIVADPCVFLRHRADASEQGVFLGVLGQHEHLNTLSLAGSEDQTALNKFSVCCEYDGIAMQPGDTRTTHWLLAWESPSVESSLNQFAELLGAYYQCPPPAEAPPVLYCSWYFYGESVTFEDVEENLAALKQHPVPIDVFLIDDGWSDSFGSWNPGYRFPQGMKVIADQIRDAGYKAGIWTCPFVVMQRSPVVAEHPELLARDENGEPLRFAYQGDLCFVVDPTSPYAEAYFDEFYGRLRDWGFTHYKFDFLRSITQNPDARFHDPSMTRAQIYRRGMQLVRNSIGDDNYILACGGLFEASIGLVDGMRIGSDTRGTWQSDNYVNTMKQNFFRAYTNRLWHTDPDAAMLRRREAPYHHAHNIKQSALSLGHMTDEEAFVVAVNQYLGGGMVCISERFAELDEDRRGLLHHIIPVLAPTPKTVDFWNAGCPSVLLSEVTPRCSALGNWHTLVVTNWANETVTRTIALNRVGLPEAVESLAVFEFRTQTYHGLKSQSDTVTLELPPHAMRVLRLAPWNGRDAMVLGTDLHITAGGVELADVASNETAISGRVTTPWARPIRVTVGLPKAGLLEPQTVTVQPGECFKVTS